MKLLFITQKIDSEDAVLGFVHRWVIELSKHFEHITVICLFRGKYDLPKNVSVFSLGKEGGESRFKYIWNFFRISIFHIRNYRSVFVHMNTEYLILGGWLWKIFGKKVFLWRNHYRGNYVVDVASWFCNKIFCTSRSSYTAKFKKTVFMPVGVDMDFFIPQDDVKREENSILFLARMAPAKRAHILLEALAKLDERGVSFKAGFYGAPLPKDVSYLDSLKRRAEELNLGSKTAFLGASTYIDGPKIYSSYEIFVNLSPSGMYDKTIFEAASCEALVLASSLDFSKIVESRFSFKQDDVLELSEKIESLLSLPDDQKKILGQELRKLAVEKHSLKALGNKLFEEIAT